MNKRNDDVSGALFLLELLRLIPRHGKITAKQLSEKLASLGHERSVRTIQRHLDVLSLHFDIERDDRAKPYGYAWAKNAKNLELAGISAEQSLLLSLAYQELKFMLPKNILRSLDGFFVGAERRLQDDAKSHISDWRNKVAIVSPTQPLLPPNIDDEIFSQISQALFYNHLLDIVYQAPNKPPKSHTVMPLALVRQEPRLYLVVRYQGHTDIRHLAVHRIISAHASGFSFTPPDDFNLKNHINDGRFGMSHEQKVRLSFCMDKNEGFHLTETPLSADQTIGEYDDYYHITATVNDSEMLDWWLAKFADGVWNVEKAVIE